jgi:uncharacterized protein YecT (DUF1311 family)
MNFSPVCLISAVFILVFPNFSYALNCKNPQAQTDMNQCAALELERETAKINKTYNNLRANLSSEQRLQIKNVQTSWIIFKDLACEFEASGVIGGSAHSMVLANCLTWKTKQRNKELELLATCEEGDLSCPAWTQKKR